MKKFFLIALILIAIPCFCMDYTVISVNGTVEYEPIMGVGFNRIEIGQTILDTTQLKMEAKSSLILKDENDRRITIRSNRTEKIGTITSLMPKVGGAAVEAETGNRTRNTKIITGATARGDSQDVTIELYE